MPALPPIRRRARARLPIYQTTAYVFEDADQAAALFNLQTVGFIYSRLTNPTNAALEARLATLEGGRGCTVASSGHAAQVLALFPLMSPGAEIVASSRLYGGSLQQMRNTYPKFGWAAKIVDADDPENFKRAVTPNTKAFFIESLANPGGVISDIEAIARIAEAAGVPLLVDNTLATPWLCKPIDYGATLIVHSTTKFLSGTGTSMGGAVVDSGKFDWARSGKFPSLAGPEPAYHGLNFFESFGDMAYTFHSHAVGLRDLGPSQAPFNAWLTMLGIETLGLRMERHCANAQKVAEYLAKHPAVAWVNYAGLARQQVPPARQEVPAQGRRLDLHLRRQGRLRRRHQGGRQRRAVLPPRQYRRCQKPDHPSRLDHPSPALRRAAHRRRRRPRRASPVDRDRNGGRHHRRSGASFEKGDVLMLSKADNEFLTRSGPGTPMGDLLRRFWMPALLSEELPERDGPPKKIRILGEDLLAFRATDGRVGIVEPHCPHRGANLYFGRNEECGLRCAFHGWKFDVDGNCVDLPTSPPESSYKDTIKLLAYPTREWGDMIWVYMGPRDQACPSCRRSRWAWSLRRAATSARNGRTATGCRASRARSTPRTSPSCTWC